MRQALETVLQARKLIIAAEIPYTRPVNHFCEMLKTAEHMSRVEKKAKEDKEAAKEVERLRRERMNRKYGKKIQKQREVEKQQQKSEEMKKVMDLRKKRPAPTSDNEGEGDEFGVGVEDDAKPSASRKGSLGKKPFLKRPKSQKREHRDSKYGFGGSKRGLKKNSKESVNEDTFDVRKNRAPFRGMGGGAKRGGMRKPGGKPQRPGKQRRQQMRSKQNSRK